MLGTSVSVHPWIFNFEAVLTGIAAIAGAIGLYRAFRATANIAIAWLISWSVAVTGVMSVKAGIFPLPDSRHASWGFLAAFTIITPLLLLIGVSKKPDAMGVRLYLIGTTVLVLLLLLFMSGAVSTARLRPGTFQRLFAIATFVLVGVVGYSVNGERVTQR